MIRIFAMKFLRYVETSTSTSQPDMNCWYWPISKLFYEGFLEIWPFQKDFNAWANLKKS